MIFTYDSESLDTDKYGNPIWPELQLDDFLPPIDLSRLTRDANHSINMAFTQYNLNQMLSDIVDGLEVIIGEEFLDLSFLTPENPADEMELAVTVNPLGIAINFTHQTNPPVALINMTDLRVVLLEGGIETVELSADITLEVSFSARSDAEGFFLDMGIAPIEALSHVNVIMDNKGLNILEHVGIVTAVFASLSGPDDDAEDAPKIPINLSDMGLNPNMNLTDSGKIEFDGNGNCFLSLAVDRVDPAKLLGEDVCFISSAFF